MERKTMSWEYQQSRQRVQHHLDTMAPIEVTKLTREANLEELVNWVKSARMLR